MYWIYLLIPILLTILFYILLERKRLVLFRQLNSISSDPDKMIKVEIPINQLSKLTRSTVSHTIDTGNAILFEYKTLVYMAIPLGEDAALVSKVADQNLIHRYRTYKV